MKTIACLLLSLNLFMNPMLQPLVSYNMPKITKPQVVVNMEDNCTSLKPLMTPKYIHNFQCKF